MKEDKSKLQLIGEIAQANNKNLELIEELNTKEKEIERLHSIIKEVREYIEKLKKENDKIINFEIKHDEYQHEDAEAQNGLIDELIAILDKENK